MSGHVESCKELHAGPALQGFSYNVVTYSNPKVHAHIFCIFTTTWTVLQQTVTFLVYKTDMNQNIVSCH